MSGDETANAATTDEQPILGEPESPPGEPDRLERQALRLLRIRDGTLQLEELASGIAALDDDVEQANEKKLRIRLHHRYLPELDERDLVSFDPSNGRVRLTQEGAHSEVAGHRGFESGSSAIERNN